MSYNKIIMHELYIPGDFGLDLKIPIWKDNLNFVESQEIIDYANKEIIDKDLHLKNF